MRTTIPCQRNCAWANCSIARNVNHGSVFKDSSKNALQRHGQSKHPRGPSTRAYAFAQYDSSKFSKLNEASLEIKAQGALLLVLLRASIVKFIAVVGLCHSCVSQCLRGEMIFFPAMDELAFLRASPPLRLRGKNCLLPKKQKSTFISECVLFDFNPATTYSPTQFPVQYNRPCEA